MRARAPHASDGNDMDVDLFKVFDRKPLQEAIRRAGMKITLEEVIAWLREEIDREPEDYLLDLHRALTRDLDRYEHRHKEGV